MDMRRRPVRISDWGEVLEAVYHADPNDEQTWLEWKSTLDLRSKEQMATIVAKAIIAFANRDPDRARTTVGGIGILLIGIEPGNVQGIVPVDNADLDKLITPYVGADGPVWQPHWTQYDGRHVLIIEVDPPKWGDPIHAFRKEFQPIRSGWPFVRKLAQSVPADYAELARLGDRRAARIDEGLDVVVEAAYPKPLSRYLWRDDQLAAFLDAETKKLMAPLDAARARRPASRPSAETRFKMRALGLSGTPAALRGLEVDQLGIGGTTPERRTEEEYETAVRDYIGSVEAAWPEVMRTLASYFVPPPTLILRNRSGRNYRQVKVRLHVAGDADAREHEPDTKYLDLWQLWPAAPRPWGPTASRLSSLIARSHLDTYMPLPPPVGPSVTVERGDGFTLTFPPFDLHPWDKGTILDDWCLLIPASRPAPVVATWTATAANVDGAPGEGELSIAFGGEDINVLQATALAVGDHGSGDD
jgi:hypothetical protein